MKNFLLISLLLLSGHVLRSQTDLITPDRIKLVETFLNDQEDLSGIFMVGSGDQVMMTKGYGFADRSSKTPYSDQTLFTIGSITKPFTATAILLLMEDAKLAITQPITTYFENVPEDKKMITIHQLLTHSSGLPGAIGDDYESINAETFRERLWKESLAFTPGTGYEYSNTGYSLLGMIVEQVSGLSYNDFLSSRIFSKAGMKTAGYTNPNADYSKLAHGYLADGIDSGTSKAKNWNGNEPYWHLKSNGGLLMSAQDMFQWYQVLRGKKILRPETLKLQITPHVDEGGGSFYGYGYAVNGQSVEHNGGNRIFKADFRWFPSDDFFFFSATNDANVRLFRLNDEVLQILKTGKLPVTHSWSELNPDQLATNPGIEVITSFRQLLKDFSVASANTFIDTYCSPGIIERNGREKLIQVFEMVSNDSQHSEVDKILTPGDHIQLHYPMQNKHDKLKITLGLVNLKLDSMNADIAGS